MKLLFASPQAHEVELLRSELDRAGIECEVRNQNAYAFFPGAELYPELWVLHEEAFSKAAELRDALLKTASTATNSWRCPACGEVSEGQFTSCWKCGAVRESAQ